jgi:hypothetical protein
LVVLLPVFGGFEIGLLAPSRPMAHEDVSRTGKLGAVVALVAVDPDGVAGLLHRPDDHRIPGYCHRIAKVVTLPRVGGFEIGLLAPGRPAPHKDIAAPAAKALSSLPSPLTPVAALSSESAPTTIVSPDTDTAWPKISASPVLEALR